MQHLTNKQMALATLERDFAQYCAEERDEIEIIRDTLREMVLKYKESAELAIIATTLEIKIRRGQ